MPGDWKKANKIKKIIDVRVASNFSTSAVNGGMRYEVGLLEPGTGLYQNYPDPIVCECEYRIRGQETVACVCDAMIQEMKLGGIGVCQRYAGRSRWKIVLDESV